jgi:hypothetical protein
LNARESTGLFRGEDLLERGRIETGGEVAQDLVALVGGAVIPADSSGLKAGFEVLDGEGDDLDADWGRGGRRGPVVSAGHWSGSGGGG